MEKPKNRTKELWWDFLILLIGLFCGFTTVYLQNSFAEFIFVALTMFVMFMAGWYYNEDRKIKPH